MNKKEKNQKIHELCCWADKLSEEYSITFITSHREKTRNTNDYNTFSVKSEFYSDELQKLIVNAFYDCGFSVNEFYNEEDFIHYIQSPNSQEHFNTLVINSAQKGTSIGRKSLIPAFCDLYGLHYIGSNPYIVSLCRDKFRCGNILKENGIKTPPSWMYSPQYGWINGKPDMTCGRLLIKPNYESSSIGVDQNCIGEFTTAFENKIYEYAKIFRQDVLVTQFISGYEVETPVICTKSPFSLVPVGIEKEGKKMIGDYILDYNTRSENQYDFYNFEEWNEALSEKLIETALKTVSLLNIQGFGRVDFRIDEYGEYYVTDVSTNPHYTKSSSYFFAFKEMGFSYLDMIKCLIASKYGRSELCLRK